MNVPTIVIEPLRLEDQAEARRLILAGLEEHWGALDPLKNPDLDDIAAAYADGLFLVARREGGIVGTGAFRPRDGVAAEIVRMSVAPQERRGGVGRMILAELIRRAAARGFSRIVLETTATWMDAVAFYLACGFRVTHRKDGDVYFAIEIDQVYTPGMAG
ncbi:MAG: GNAT family N-acetyltransferase [Chloroflexi bacterium]|nr:GNAT family N-acetyltransferase [Chloroflexota bacterium]